MTIDYKISSTLTVKDELTSTLEKIALVGKQVNEQMAALVKNLNAISSASIKAASAASGFASKQSREFNEFAASANKAQSAAANLGREMAVLASRSSQPISGGFLALGSGGRGSGGSISSREPEFYGGQRVMRDIGGHDASGGGGGRGSGGGGGRGGAPNPSDPMSSMYVGMQMQHYGMAMFESLEGPLEKAMELEKIKASLQQKGLGQDQIKDALDYSKATQIYGTSIIERARIFNDAQGSFRESGMQGKEALQAAKTMMPVLASYQVAMGTLDEKTKAAAAGAFNNLNKIVELQGGLGSTQKATEIVDSVFKAVQSSGKMVNERELKNFIVQGGSAVSQLSNSTIFAALEPLIGELGGMRVGTGMNTAAQRLNARTALPPKMMAQEYMRLGIWDKNQINFNSQGGIKSFKNRDKVVDKDLSDAMNTDTIKFTKMLMDIYTSHGIKTQKQREQENAILFNQTGQRVYNKTMSQLSTMEKSVAAFNSAHGVAQTNADQKDSPMQKVMEMHKKYDDLMLHLGEVAMPMAIKALEFLNPLLERLSNFVEKNSETVEVLMYGFLGLATAMTAIGTIATVQAITNLGGALGGLNPSIMAAVGGISKLGLAAGVAAAAFAGFAFGTWLYNAYLAGTKFSDWLGEFIAQVLGFLGNDEANASLKRMGKKPAGGALVDSISAVAPQIGGVINTAKMFSEWLNKKDTPNASAPPKQAINVQVHAQMDGTPIYTKVTKTIADQLTGPMTSTSSYDDMMSYHPTGMPSSSGY